jgi:hypothetical protein
MKCKSKVIHVALVFPYEVRTGPFKMLSGSAICQDCGRPENEHAKITGHIVTRQIMCPGDVMIFWHGKLLDVIDQKTFRKEYEEVL